MGFGLELAFIRKIIDLESAKRYAGHYLPDLPAERNDPAAQLFGNAGFEKTRDTVGARSWVRRTFDAVPV